MLFFVAGLRGFLPSVEPPTPLRSQDAFAARGRSLRGDQDKTAIHHRVLSKDARTAFIRRANVWKPTDIPTLDLRAGPDGAGAFQPGQVVTCDYRETPRHGKTPKFRCTLPDGDVVKVRYGADNGEVQGATLATRLLWALGFAADRVYPVRVRCRGCSSDPWKNGGSGNEVHEFDPAVIERKPSGHLMWEGDKDEWGWSWPELDGVDENEGGAPPEQLDALKLLAVFMQHSDTKPQQQRLLCLKDGFSKAGECEKPFLMLHDVGLTFGRANRFNKNSIGSVNFAAWRRTPIWKDPAACIGNLSKSKTGTLADPRISEAGRAFLADLLVQLSDRQLRDLFDVAGAARRTDSSGKILRAPVDDWVAVFDQKRDEIVTNHCSR